MGLQGNIETFAVVDVLRLLAGTRSAGRLAVTSGGATAHLDVRDSCLTGATATPPGGPEVPADPAEMVVEVMRLRQGTFEFIEIEHAGDDPTTGLPIDDAIDVGAVIVEQWEEILAVVPSVRAAISLCAEGIAGQVVLSERQWSAVCAFSGGSATVTVDLLGRRLGWSDFEVMGVVAELVTAGLVVLRHRSRPPAERGLPAPGASAPSDLDSFSVPNLSTADVVASMAAAPPPALEGSVPVPVSVTVPEPGSAESIARQVALLSPAAAEAVLRSDPDLLGGTSGSVENEPHRTAQDGRDQVVKFLAMLPPDDD